MPKPEFADYSQPCRSCQAVPSVNLGGLCVHCVETIMEYHNQHLIETLDRLIGGVKIVLALLAVNLALSGALVVAWLVA
ncbi:MAG: hypothetical protein V3S82_10330 [Dehalococcoidia bacterium]